MPLKIRGYPAEVTCTCCGSRVIENKTMYDDEIGYVCDKCYEVKDYFTSNDKTKGEGGRSFSIEFETDKKEVKQYKLLKMGFLPTKDASINGIEWKSPIFYSKRSALTAIKAFEKFKDAVTHRCGTHIHVGIRPEVKAVARQYRHELFDPLLSYMIGSPETTKAFWGRDFNSFARACLDHAGRYSAFSTDSKYSTIEFRLPKFVSAYQYYSVLKFCIDIIEIIEEEYDRVNDSHNSYELEVAMRIAGNRILEHYFKCLDKYFEKYFENERKEARAMVS